MMRRSHDYADRLTEEIQSMSPTSSQQNSRRRSRPLRRRFRPLVVELESRQLLSVFTVTTVMDNGDNVNPTQGSFRQAIVAANSNAGYDTIDFDIPGGGTPKISLMAPL